jgi:predicted peptidase
MIEQAKAFEAQITQTVKLDYLLHLPDNYHASAKRKWPLILFLHGAGERGDDLALVKVHGIPKVAMVLDEFPFIAVSPQCPPNHWWSDFSAALIMLLDAISTTYAVDADRVYLTGLSMGGFGTWHLAVEYPHRFAAIVPICGGGVWAYGFPERVSDIKHLPVWAFHGAKDDLVPLRESEVLVETLQKCGGDAKLTVYPEAGHDSWTETYNNPELYAWFLSHSRQ